jgi:hypothetical protein
MNKLKNAIVNWGKKEIEIQLGIINIKTNKFTISYILTVLFLIWVDLIILYFHPYLV